MRAVAALMSVLLVGAAARARRHRSGRRWLARTSARFGVEVPVPWADRVLRVGTSGWRFGLLFGAWAAGALVAAFLMPRLSRRFGAIRHVQAVLLLLQERIPRATALFTHIARLAEVGHRPPLARHVAGDDVEHGAPGQLDARGGDGDEREVDLTGGGADRGGH